MAQSWDVNQVFSEINIYSNLHGKIIIIININEIKSYKKESLE